MADNKYSNGKIYKIVDNTSDKVYIGSTCKTLKRRLTAHEEYYRNYLYGTVCYITSYDIIKNGNYHIELIEELNATNKKELEDRERYHIMNTPNTVNKVRHLNRTLEERKKYLKQYCIENKTKLYKKYRCSICDGCFKLRHKSTHCKTKRHQNYETKHKQMMKHIDESLEIVNQLVNALNGDDFDEAKRLNECISMGFQDKPI
jgi:inorganic triphosphatase YgiF